VLHACRDSGSVVRVVDRGTSDPLRTEPLPVESLRDLFQGPDRILHLREDGAHELWVRTGGVVERIAAEVGAWVRAGIAHWADGRLVLTRDTIDALRRGVATTDAWTTRATGRGVSSARGEDFLAVVALSWPDARPELLAAVTGEKAWRLDAELDALETGGRV